MNADNDIARLLEYRVSRSAAGRLDFRVATLRRKPAGARKRPGRGAR
jgi:hypothetical protein